MKCASYVCLQHTYFQGICSQLSNYLWPQVKQLVPLVRFGSSLGSRLIRFNTILMAERRLKITQLTMQWEKVSQNRLPARQAGRQTVERSRCCLGIATLNQEADG